MEKALDVGWGRAFEDRKLTPHKVCRHKQLKQQRRRCLSTPHSIKIGRVLVVRLSPRRSTTSICGAVWASSGGYSVVHMSRSPISISVYGPNVVASAQQFPSQVAAHEDWSLDTCNNSLAVIMRCIAWLTAPFDSLMACFLAAEWIFRLFAS